MRLPQPLMDAVNDQITLELGSSLTYLQMAAFFEERSLMGFAHWMRLQSEEERGHALRFFDHLLHRGGTVSLGAVPAPRSDFGTPLEVFEASLEQERAVSEAITRMYRCAEETGDAASLPLLQWFLTEQVEEEAAVEAILDRLRLVGNDGGALLILDRELAARTAQPG